MARARSMALATLLGLATASGAVAAALTPQEGIANDRQSYDEIARGRYLAILGDCSGCHTKPGGKPYAGGYPITTPFGDLLSPNLTPDKDTGIGNWSDDQFVAAVQQGVAPEGHLYPAMPYTNFAAMSRQDVLAIRAYLATLEPVHNSVVANQLPFPFRIRASMIGWNALFFHPHAFQPTQGKSAEWNRGAYLVEGPAHCGVCHTTKNFLGGDKSGSTLQGAVLQGWFSPDITQDKRTGLADWNADDIVAYLKTGHNRISAATGPMAEVIADSTSQMSESDLRAIATYLKDMPAPHAPSAQPVTTDDPAMRAGEAIYVDQCAACHNMMGTGEANIFPPLKDSPIVQSDQPTSLIRVVIHGTRNVATPEAPTGAAMPAYGWKLSDQQAAAVLTYIRNSWGNAASAVSAGQVKDQR
jgi:mono/diheme cytochrome c family protein